MSRDILFNVTKKKNSNTTDTMNNNWNIFDQI